MRDDLAVLFNLIKQHQDKKIELLTDFRNKEFELKHLLAGGTEEGIIELLSSEDALIEEIDLCDYGISSNIDQIKVISGIDLLNSEIERSIQGEVQLEEFRKKLSRIDKIFEEINRLKSENIKTMQRIADETSGFSDELDRIDKVHCRFAKDLQSS